MTQPEKSVVLLRHAESLWNLQNRFTGWTDVDLSEAGCEEARIAGQLLHEHGFRFDLAFTSRLKRAMRTVHIVLGELKQLDIPIVRGWELNERHYGALQGLNKQEVAAQYGAEQFRRWRRGYVDRPPPLGEDDPRHPRFEPLYADLDSKLLPATESLEDTYQRTIRYWEQEIVPRVREDKKVIVVAHGNTFRGLLKYLDKLSDAEVEHIEIPTGRPLVCVFSPDLQPLRHYYLGGDE